MESVGSTYARQLKGDCIRRKTREKEMKKIIVLYIPVFLISWKKEKKSVDF